MVAVAQLVESRIVIPVVVGSSPISHPIPVATRCTAALPGTLSACGLWCAHVHDGNHAGRMRVRCAESLFGIIYICDARDVFVNL